MKDEVPGSFKSKLSSVRSVMAGIMMTLVAILYNATAPFLT